MSFFLRSENRQRKSDKWIFSLSGGNESLVLLWPIWELLTVCVSMLYALVAFYKCTTYINKKAKHSLMYVWNNTDKKKRTNKLDKHKTLLLRAYTERFEHKINGDRNSDHHRILINYSQNSKMLSIRDVELEHSAQIHIYIVGIFSVNNKMSHISKWRSEQMNNSKNVNNSLLVLLLLLLFALFLKTRGKTHTLGMCAHWVFQGQMDHMQTLLTHFPCSVGSYVRQRAESKKWIDALFQLVSRVRRMLSLDTFQMSVYFYACSGCAQANVTCHST